MWIHLNELLELRGVPQEIQPIATQPVIPVKQEKPMKKPALKKKRNSIETKLDDSANVDESFSDNEPNLKPETPKQIVEQVELPPKELTRDE